MNCGSSSMLNRRKNTPYRCYAWIVSDLEKKTITFICAKQARQLLVGILDHGAELQHRERLAIDSDAFTTRRRPGPCW